jgi:hypothetical protein
MATASRIDLVSIAGDERPELVVAAGLPEIDFVELRAMAQQVEPVAVGYPDVGFHGCGAEITSED